METASVVFEIDLIIITRKHKKAPEKGWESLSKAEGETMRIPRPKHGATLEVNFIYGFNIIELIWYTRLTFFRFSRRNAGIKSRSNFKVILNYTKRSLKITAVEHCHPSNSFPCFAFRWYFFSRWLSESLLASSCWHFGRSTTLIMHRT